MFIQKNTIVMKDAPPLKTKQNPYPFARFRALYATILLAVLSVASPSYADTASEELLVFWPTEIAKVGVNNDGTAYIPLSVINFSAFVKIKLDAEVSGRVKSWKTWLRVKIENGGWVDFNGSATSKSYSPIRPKTVNKNVHINVSAFTLATWAPAMCNLRATQLRAQGMSNEEIFSQDRTIPVAVDARLDFEFTGINGSLFQADNANFSSSPKLSLVCKGRTPTSKSTAPPPRDIRVNDIKLFLTTYSGTDTKVNPSTSCKKVKLHVRLQTSKVGPVKIRLWKKIGDAPMGSTFIDAWAFDDGTGDFFANYIEWITATKTTEIQAMAEELVSVIGKTTQWEEITLLCDSGSLQVPSVPGKSDTGKSTETLKRAQP